jgi:hypothetical protein
MAAPSTPNEQSKFSKLMKAMGSSDGFDPIPPAQYLCFLHKDAPPLQRLLAWVRSKTIRKGHWSAYCVDESGNELHLKDLGKALDWDKANVHRTWGDAETKGLVRREGAKLCLCGSVLPSQLTDSKEALSVQTTFSPDLRRQIAKLSKAERVKFETQYKLFEAFKKPLEAQAMAEARRIEERLEDTILSTYGLRKSRPIRTIDEKKPQLLHMELKETPNFVQTTATKDCTDYVSEVVQGDFSAVQGSAGRPIISVFTPDTDSHAAAAIKATELPAPDRSDENGLLLLLSELTARNLTIAESYGERIVRELHGAPIEAFLAVLNRRMKHGSIGTGVLTKIAGDARREFEKEAGLRAEALEQARADTALERKKNLSLYRKVIADPAGYRPEEVEYARRELAEEQAEVA